MTLTHTLRCLFFILPRIKPWIKYKKLKENTLTLLSIYAAHEFTLLFSHLSAVTNLSIYSTFFSFTAGDNNVMPVFTFMLEFFVSRHCLMLPLFSQDFHCNIVPRGTYRLITTLDAPGGTHLLQCGKCTFSK